MEQLLTCHLFSTEAGAQLQCWLALLQGCEEERGPAETKCPCGQDPVGEEEGIWGAAQEWHRHQSTQGMPCTLSAHVHIMP